MAWFDEAVELGGSPEPNAMQVATVDDAGRPSLRTVLAKAHRRARRHVLHQLRLGRRAAIWRRTRYAAAQFLWLAHERQVRLTGTGARGCRAEETAAYFHSRPRGSQLGAWASPQSTVIASRAELEQA